MGECTFPCWALASAENCEVERSVLKMINGMPVPRRIQLCLATAMGECRKQYLLFRKSERGGLLALLWFWLANRRLQIDRPVPRAFSWSARMPYWRLLSGIYMQPSGFYSVCVHENKWTKCILNIHTGISICVTPEHKPDYLCHLAYTGQIGH